MNGRPGEPAIRGVVFDFGGVIHSFNFGLFFRKLGSRTQRTSAQMTSLVAGSDLPRRYELGEISSGEFYRGMAALCGLRASEEEFVSAFVGIFTPIASTISLIRSLSRSYRLGLLSNTNEWHFERHIRAVEIFPLFDAVTLSYRVRAMKPSERIYIDLLERIGLSPEECVFVDDLEENVEGARKVGIHAIRYRGHEDLVSSLAALGVSA